MSLSVEALEYLEARGLSLAEVIEFARIQATPKDRTGAERQARHRAKVKAEQETVTVTRDVTRDTVTDAPLSRPPNEINSNPPTPTPETHTPRVRADDFPRPVWAEPQVWADLKRNRKTKRLTNTATAHSEFVAGVEAMADDEWPPGRLLKAIVAKGWGGAHDPREDRKPTNGQRPQNQRETTRQTGERVAARYAAAGGGPAKLLLGPGSSGWDARERG